MDKISKSFYRRNAMNIKFILPILMLAVLSGCATTPMTWQKQGVSAYDTQNQLSKCRYEVGMVGKQKFGFKDSLSKIGGDDQTQLVADCMMSQGFRYR